MGRQAKMRERDKQMVEDYYFHQKSMPEIAKEQGITPQAVHKLIHSQKAEKYLSEIQERATKRARSFLIGISGKAARVMAEAMDEKDPDSGGARDSGAYGREGGECGCKHRN